MWRPDYERFIATPDLVTVMFYRETFDGDFEGEPVGGPRTRDDWRYYSAFWMTGPGYSTAGVNITALA